MKNSFLFIALLCCLTFFGQQKFVRDACGHVDDAAFTQLMRDRQYTLVGSFVPVSHNPDLQYAKVSRYGKWGFIDTEGKEVIKPQYNFISDFKNGLAMAIFEEYRTSRDGGYDDVGNSQVVNQYVCINTKGERVSKAYDDIRPSQNGFAVVKRGTGSGVINPTGVEVIPPEYKYVFVQTNYIFASTPAGKWGAFTHAGKPLVPFVYDNLRWFNGFLLGYTSSSYCLLHPDTGKPLGKGGYINNVHDYNADYNTLPFKPNVLAVCTEKGSFLVNRQGRRISDVYEDGVRQASDHYYRVQRKSGMGVINDKGKEVLACNYVYAGPYEDGTMFFAKKGDVVQYINPKGKAIDVSAYETVGNFGNGRAYVRVNGDRFGFIDYEGRLVIPAIYDHPSSGFEYSKENAAIRKDGKWGIINPQGETVTPFIYDELYPGYKCYYTTINHKKGLLDDNGREVIAPQYQSLGYIPTGNGLLQAQLNGKWGIIDLQNNVLVPFEYDGIERDYMDQGLVLVEKDERSGIINLQGKILVPLDYDISWTVDNFGAGLIPVDKEQRRYLADFYGHIYNRPEINEYY